MSVAEVGASYRKNDGNIEVRLENGAVLHDEGATRVTFGVLLENNQSPVQFEVDFKIQRPRDGDDMEKWDQDHPDLPSSILKTPANRDMPGMFYLKNTAQGGKAPRNALVSYNFASLVMKKGFTLQMLSTTKAPAPIQFAVAGVLEVALAAFLRPYFAEDPLTLTPRPTTLAQRYPLTAKLFRLSNSKQTPPSWQMKTTSWISTYSVSGVTRDGFFQTLKVANKAFAACGGSSMNETTLDDMISTTTWEDDVVTFTGNDTGDYEIIEKACVDVIGALKLELKFVAAPEMSGIAVTRDGWAPVEPRDSESVLNVTRPADLITMPSVQIHWSEQSQNISLHIVEELLVFTLFNVRWNTKRDAIASVGKNRFEEPDGWKLLWNSELREDDGPSAKRVRFPW